VPVWDLSPFISVLSSPPLLFVPSLLTSFFTSDPLLFPSLPDQRPVITAIKYKTGKPKFLKQVLGF